MNCPNCGNEINDNENFCGNCGTKITKEKEYEEITTKPTNNSGISDSNNNNEINEEEKRKGNKLCIASAIALIIILPLLSIYYSSPKDYYYGPDFLSNVSSTFGGMVSIYAILSYLVGLVLMIIARVKYPKNKIAKILMWIYIALFAALIFWTLIISACQVWAYQNCSGCN